MKLPVAQTTTSLPVSQRQAVTQATPAMLTAPREKYIPEQTADQIARLYTTKANAKMSVASSWSGTLNKFAVAEKRAQAAAQTAEEESSFAKLAHTYSTMMGDRMADQMVNGATSIRQANDSAVGGEVTHHPWRTMDEDWKGYANFVLHGGPTADRGPVIGLLKSMGITKGAETRFNKWRVTYDKQALDKIRGHMRTQMIDLAGNNYKETAERMSSITELTAHRDTAISTGLSNKFVWDVWDAEVRRVNQDDVTMYINEFAIAAGNPNSHLMQSDFERLKSRVMFLIGTGEDDLPLPEGAREQIHKSLETMQTRMGELVEQRQDVALVQLTDKYEKAREAGDVDAIQVLRTAANSTKARLKYGKNLTAVHNLLIGVTESAVNNSESDTALTMMITKFGGQDAKTDARLMREINDELGAKRLSLTAYNRQMNVLKAHTKDRRTRRLGQASYVLRAFFVRGLSDEKLESLLDTEDNMKRKAEHAAAQTALDNHFMNNTGEMDLLAYVMKKQIGSQRAIKPWMRTGSDKPVDDDPESIMPRLASVSMAASRARIHKLRADAVARGDDPAVIEAVHQERLGQLRDVQNIRIFIDAFHGHLPAESPIDDRDDEMDNWIRDPRNRATILENVH
jgi:hypothetical protein